jgi:para-aminobenzoate synthetase component 1
LFRRLPRGARFRLGGAAAAPTFGERPVRVLTGEDVAGIPKDALRAALPRVPDSRRAGFPGGAVGFVAYERGYDIEALPSAPSTATPDLWFGIYDTFATMFPATNEIEVTSWGLVEDGTFDERTALARAEDMEERLHGEAPVPASVPVRANRVGSIRASLDEAGHARAVAEILEAIRRGDLYQGNLTVRFDVATSVDPVDLFERLLQENPAPHSLFLETDAGTVVSSSPERLLAARGSALQTRPIKGTSPRDSNPARDAALARSLLASEKDRAELLMITDLLRNDLGKVCDPGSVRVPALAEIESFPHLHHLVSTIVGRLAPGLDVFDALEAVFPCGSIAGAPKRRAMEILRALEPAPRGLYTGTVGWVGFDRSADFAVAIRTGFLADGVFSFGSGGGIVADSTASSEWEELLLKARAFALALDADLRAATGTSELAARSGRPT